MTTDNVDLITQLAASRMKTAAAHTLLRRLRDQLPDNIAEIDDVLNVGEAEFKEILDAYVEDRTRA